MNIVFAIEYTSADGVRDWRRSAVWLSGWCSGGAYRFVPTRVISSDSDAAILATPKSAILTTLRSPESSRLFGFTSLWITWRLCANCTASSTCSPGTISPSANTRIWNLPLVASAQRREMPSAAPESVSRLFGKLDASRHLTSACAP